jgi:subtilisin family serine protease
MSPSLDPMPASVASRFGGVPQGREGLILQRGGEELVLAQVPDRLTLRLKTPGAPTWWPELAQSCDPIPGVALVELQVTDATAALARIRALPDVQFASHVYQVQRDPQTRIYLTDELTIQAAQGVSAAAIDSLTQQLGLSRQQAVAGLDQTAVFRVTAAATENPIKLANRLMSLPEIVLAEANIVLRSRSHYRPKDSLYPRQWYLGHSGGPQLAANSHIDAERAWDITRGDRSVVIAVADDGIDINHPDLQGLGKIVAPRDLRDDDFVPLPGTADNHGTAVAGIAVAEENGQGCVGVAPGCALMPIRTTGFLDDRSVELVFQWAIANGAAVICCSWGAGAVKFPLSLRQRAVITQAATQGRNGKGCIIVFAAGNFNRPLNSAVSEQGWPKDLLRGTVEWLNGFAVHPDVLTIGACTSLNKKAAYSNWGDEIFLCAPSNNAPPGIWLEQTGFVDVPPILTAALQGTQLLTIDRGGTSGYDPTDYSQAFGGTSAACPIVAGVIGLMLSINPTLSTAEIKRILQQSTDKILDPDPDPQFNVNFGSYEQNGHSRWFGYGKINAFKSVLAAQQTLQPTSAPTRQIQVGGDQPIAIPDNNSLSIPIVISEYGSIKSIGLDLQIDHSFLGDLEIRLIAPFQEQCLIQPRSLGRQTKLDGRYSHQNTPGLKRLLQRSIQGTWQLEIKDCSPENTGALVRWQLTIGL